MFYFGSIADLTPPVALAAYAGSAIARSNPLKTGVVSTRLAVGAFILPHIFVLSPALLLIDVTFVSMLLAVVSALVGMVALSPALAGYLVGPLPVFARLILTAAGLMLLVPGLTTDLIGLLALGGTAAVQVLLGRQARRAP